MRIELSLPDNVIFCSLVRHHAGWQVTLMMDDSWKIQGQCIYGTRAHGEYAGDPQSAADFAVEALQRKLTEMTEDQKNRQQRFLAEKAKIDEDMADLERMLGL